MDSIYMEFLYHLNSLHIILPKNLCEYYTIQESHLTIHQDAQLGFPFIVDVTSLIIESHSDCILLKLKVKSHSMSLDNSSQILLDASYLQDLKGILCKNCKFQLNIIQWTKLANTPSEYWHELLDCWACHKEDYSGLPGQKGGIIFAQEKSCFTSNSYLIVHPKDVVDMIKIPKNNTKSFHHWSIIQCPQCSDTIGEQADKETDTVESIRIHKYAVDFQLSTCIVSRSFSTFFCQELYEAARAHSTFRYQIKGHTDYHLYLWIITSDLFVNSDLNESSDYCFDKAFKIMYKTSPNDSKNEWESDKTVEVLHLELNQVELLYKLLRESIISRYELSRIPNGFQLGILKWNT